MAQNHRFSDATIGSCYTIARRGNQRVIVKRSMYRSDGDRYEVVPVPEAPRFWLSSSGHFPVGGDAGSNNPSFSFALGSVVKAVKQGNRLVVVNAFIYNGTSTEDQYLCSPLVGGGSEELFNENELSGL